MDGKGGLDEGSTTIARGSTADLQFSSCTLADSRCYDTRCRHGVDGKSQIEMSRQGVDRAEDSTRSVMVHSQREEDTKRALLRCMYLSEADQL
jgi:hypothetical protein